MAPNPRARSSGDSCGAPASKRRKTSRAADPAASLGDPETCEETTEASASCSAPMDTSLRGGSSKASVDSASASNSTSEEAQSTSAGPASRSGERGDRLSGSGPSEGSHRPGPSDLSGALGSFLKRTSQFEEPSGASRFSAMFRDLKSDDGTRQILALTELSEYLSFSSEEALISFPMETFIPVLISLLEDPGHGDETAAQAMLLCCRCLFNVVDILPPTTRIITAAGGLPVLCANLLNVAYIDVAELAVAIIERISEDQPLQVLKAGGLQAILTFLDFFQIAVQRQAVSAAALMLLPIPPPEVFDQHVRPVLPTLAQLLQHGDPQILQSVCECWRRVLDNAIIIHGRPRSGSLSMGPSSSLGRMVAKGKWRGGPGDRAKKDKEETAADASASGSNAPVPLAMVLEEMCPGSMLSHLLMLLSNGISSPSPHTSVVMAEVLYILSVLTNYSDTFTREVLKQDICSLLRQMVLAADLSHGGHTVTSSQTSFALLRVLAAVASILPAVHLSDGEFSCECEEKRLSLFKEDPEQLDTLGKAFLPLLVDVYEASMDPCVQSLCITLLLSFFLACREQPETIKRSLDSTRLACFLANLLLVGTSKSVVLACLLIVYELLERHPQPYSLLFVRHGVVRAIHRLVIREDESQRRAARATGKAAEPKARKNSAALASPKARARSKTQLVEEAAHRVLSSYFASSSHAGESLILRALGKIAKQLRSSPGALIAAHREALNKLHDLLLTSDGITAFEFTCSGTASALNAFLYPAHTFSGPAELAEAYGDRLRLFIDCIGKSSSGAFVKLVRLCVAAVQRNEQQPLMLFPTHASLMTALPPHLRLHVPPGSVGGKGEGPGSGRNSFGFGGELPPGMGSRVGGRGHDPNVGSSTSLSVLRLLAKPVRVRMAPHGALSTPSSGSSNALPNFRTLLMPFGAKATPPRLLEPKAGSQGVPSAMPTKAVPASDISPATTASPAARLRNYLASKVSRKRSVSNTGSAASAAAMAPAEKRSGVSSLLAKGRASAPAVSAAMAQALSEESWPPGSGSWEADEEARGSEASGPGSAAAGGSAAAPAFSETASGSSARGSGDRPSPRDRDDGPRSLRDREREALGEIFEAVLLVEPLASVAALEDYIWEKHGPRHGGGELFTSASSAGSTMSPTANTASAMAAAAMATAAASSAGATAGSASASAGAELGMLTAVSTPGSAASASGAGSGAPAATGTSSASASSFSEVKQPALGTPRDRHPLSGADSEAASPRTPVATILDPELPPEASLPPAQADGGPPDLLARGVRAPTGAQTQGASASGAASGHSRKRVQIYLNGQVLTSRTSIVQALVTHASRLPKGRSQHEESSHRSSRTDRFLVSTEDESSSEADESWDSGPFGSHASSRHFCGSIWGRVHAMTYELADESSTPNDADKPNATSSTGEGSQLQCAAVVATEFDCLVQRHQRIAACISSLQEKAPGACGTTAAAVEQDDAVPAELTPRSAASKEEPSEGAQIIARNPSAAIDQEALAMMLQLVAAFHNVCEYLRVCQGPSASEITSFIGLADDDDFQCNSLTSKLLRQLSDPLAICTGSIPPWCTKLSGTCRFLFPNSARRILHHSCNLGLSRALHHVQQRTLAQNAHSQEMQRRLEAEVAVANIPRQKVRISRQRILESAIKVMNLYGSSNTILEVEYVGEVGTGSGPTLEFYAQVAEILRNSELRLFRQGVPGGMLFPEPSDVEWLQKGTDQQASQIIERFRLLGQIVAKCILDNRLVDLQLHPFFWRAVLGDGPFSQRSLRDLDPALYASLQELRGMDAEALSQLCVDFTLPGHPKIELKPSGASVSLAKSNVDDYVACVTEVSIISAVAPQVAAFRNAFAELLPLETCRIWSEQELASVIMGSSVRDDAFWTTEHLASHIKAQHGYSADSRCFRDLLGAMSEFDTETRRRFLTFVTGAPSLPIGGFAGLKPPLTVVKKESPPAPLTPDQFMPSVMTCANYLKLPEYSTEEILRQKLEVAMREGQSAFLLS